MKEITVGKKNCDFTTIQEALNAAQDGDTIFVKPGIYYGSLRITKRINLIGSTENIMNESSAKLPIVSLKDFDNESVKIETDGATIEGILFKGNFYSEDDNFENFSDYAKKSNRSDDNECYDPNSDSDYLVCVNGNSILKNVGIYDAYCNGIGFFSREAEFSDSVIFNCNIGINLGIKGTLTANPKFHNLYVSDCIIGMKSVNESNPVVSDSMFFRNIIFGIWTINKSKGTYSNCKIIGTAHTGIVIDDKSSPVFDSCEIDSNSIGFACLGNSSLEIKNSHISKTQTEYSFKYQPDSDLGPEVPPLYYLPYFSETNNFFHILGKGIYFYGYGCSLKVQNCNFDNNVDGIRFAEKVENSVSIENSTFSENENGIFVERLDGSSFNESFVKNCQMFKNGCGIFFQDSSNNCVENCKIYENKTGIRLFKSENIKISSCQIYSNNEKKRWQPGIKVEHSSAIVENCEIFNHIGVGIRVENRGKLYFSNCNFHDNRVNIEKISAKGERISENAPLQNEKIEISAPVVYEDYKRDFDEDDIVEEQKRAEERARIEEEERKRIEFENSPEHQKFLAEQKEIKEHEERVESERKSLQETAFTKANIEKDFITVSDEITTTGISRTLVSAELFKISCKQSVNDEDSKKNAQTLKSFVNDFFQFAKNKAGGKYRLPTVSELKLLYEADKSAVTPDSCELTESDECVFVGSDGTLQTKPREGSKEYNFRICKTISVKKIEKPKEEVETPKPHFDYIYEIDKQNNGVVLKGCKDTSVKEFVIPAEIDGMKVVHIAKDALSNLRCLETLKFELFETKNISSFSLNEWSSLKQIQIGDTIKFRIR